MAQTVAPAPKSSSTQIDVHLPNRPTERVAVDIKGVSELGQGLKDLSAAVSSFPEKALQRIEARVDLLQTSYYSGMVSGGGIALILALVFHFLSRQKPRT